MRAILIGLFFLGLWFLTACSNAPVDGATGPQGTSAAFSEGPAGVDLCANGGIVLNVGLDTNNNHVLNLAEVTSSVVICNGLRGEPGVNAPTSLSPVAVLAPCALDPMNPTASELADPRLEVFLKLSNGMVLSSVSDNLEGYNTHWGVVTNGSYMSTGAGNCTFTVTNGVITR